MSGRVVLIVFGGLAAGAQTLANTERVTSMWVSAEIPADGSARISEVIDYDFGHSDNLHVTMDGHKVPYEDLYQDEECTAIASSTCSPTW